MSGTTLALVGILAGSPVVGALVARYLRPPQTQAEQIEDLRTDATEDRARIERLEARFKRLGDYAHVLRQHISDGNPPPPPPWPEGIDQ